MGCRPNTCLSLEGCCVKHCCAVGRGASKVEEGWNPRWCVEVTAGYWSHLGSLEAFISVLKNQKYHGDQLQHWVLVTNGPGLLSSGEAHRTLACTCGAQRGARSAARCTPPCCGRPSGGSLGWFEEVSGPVDTSLLELVTWIKPCAVSVPCF